MTAKMSDEIEKLRIEMRDGFGKLTKNMEVVMLEVHLLSKKMELLTDAQRNIEKRLEGSTPSEEQKLCMDEGKGATGADLNEAETKNERMDKELHRLSKDRHINMMFLAIREGRFKDLKYLIERRNLPVSARTKNGDNLLYRALEVKSKEMINYIMEHGAELKLDDKECEKILCFACKLGDLDVVKFMCLHDVNLHVETEGMPIIHIASQHGHIEIVKYLHKQGVDLLVQDKNRNTPLHTASERGQLEIIKYFHQHGVSLSVKGKSSYTPLHIACRYDQLEAVKLLHELGADPKAKDHHKHDPVYHVDAKSKQGAEIIAYLKPYS